MCLGENLYSYNEALRKMQPDIQFIDLQALSYFFSDNNH